MPAEPADRLDSEIADAFAELYGHMLGHLEGVARRIGLPLFCVKAMHMLEAPLAMKALGQRFRCDPSFVTAIADTLDAHGLGIREPDPRDRRIKHLRLTGKGLQVRERIEHELQRVMPWTQALDADERRCLLGHLRKMAQAAQDPSLPAAMPAAANREATGQEVTATPAPAASGGS